MIRCLATVVAVAVATWESWRWIAVRVADSPEEAAPLLAAVAVLPFVVRAEPRDEYRAGMPLVLIAMLLLLHAASQWLLPPIGRAGIAALAILVTGYAAVTGRRPPLALLGLTVLCLPVLPSLQFMLGYWLRMASTVGTVALLQAQGYAVSRDGTLLVWRGELMQFDAVCSGVNMLWAGQMFTLMGALTLRLGVVRTAAACAAGFGLALAANVLRGASLFAAEVGGFGALPGLHDAVGLVAFALAAVVMLVVLRGLSICEAKRW